MIAEATTTTETTTAPAEVAHGGCPYCYRVAPAPGDIAITLCGQPWLVTTLTHGPTGRPDCPACVEIYRDVIADGACPRCP